MSNYRKDFTYRKSKALGAVIGTLLLTTTTVLTVNAIDSDESNTAICNDYNESIITVENGIEISTVVPEVLVSHAGGRINGKSYTNSKESLDKSYERGYRFIELDFQWTTDGNLVLIHDWDTYTLSAFGIEPKKCSTYEFKSLLRLDGLTQMTLDDLAEWIYDHKDVYIITDIKSDNVKALKLIKDTYPDLIGRIIPQIYKMEEYAPVKDLGYTNIILTLYASNYSDEEIIDFVRQQQVFAITIPIYRARTDLPKKLKRENVFVYAHTINDHSLRQELELYGIDGFYTDDILPLSWGIDQVNKAKEYNLINDINYECLNEYITREEVCELIVNLYEAMTEKEVVLPSINKFIDTESEEVLKANALGIVNGIKETQFSPKSNVSKEEMATMIYRTLKLVDEDIVKGKFQITFSDEGEISKWARDAVGFLGSCDILSGVGSNRLDPKSSVTKEQAIILVKRVYERFKLDLEKEI